MVKIGGQSHVMENAAHQALQVVGLTADAISRPTQGTLRCRAGLGKMMAIGRHHTGPAEFVLVKRFEDFARRSFVRDDNGVPAGTKCRFDRR